MKFPRHLRIGILSLLVLAAAMFWWFKTPPPLVGGGEADGLLARWVKSGAYAATPREEERRFARLTGENANGWYGITREPLQTFSYYRSQIPQRPTLQRRTLVLQPLGAFDSRDWKLLGALKTYCEAFFQLPTRIAPPLSLDMAGRHFRPSALKLRTSGAGNRQLDAAYLISKVLTPRLPRDAVAYLGVTMSDLYVEGLSFNFGLASWSDRTGVYSLARYRRVVGGQPEPNQSALVLRRSALILSHETGHMLGITHCTFYKCAMNGANSLSDADDTPLAFCPICRRKLEWNLGCDATKRLAELARFYRVNGLNSMLVTAENSPQPLH